MSLPNDARHAHPWDFPDCPDCDGHIYVDRAKRHGSQWVCHKCDRYFETD